jgi:hypothetical protein
VRHSVLGRPAIEPGSLFVDAADEACGNEDEVLIRLALHVHGEQLHILRGQLCEQGRNPDMNHRDADVRFGEVQRHARDLDGDSQAFLQVDGCPAPEQPVVHLLAVTVRRRVEVPAVRDIHVVG